MSNIPEVGSKKYKAQLSQLCELKEFQDSVFEISLQFVALLKLKSSVLN